SRSWCGWCFVVLAIVSCRCSRRRSRRRSPSTCPAARGDPRRAVAGGFTTALVCEQARVRMLVFVNAMIPVPGESAGEWWANTGWEEARVAAAHRGGYSPDFDLATYFLHGLPPEVAKRGEARERPEADVVFGEPCRFEAWPAVPMRVIAGRDDRFFPLEFQRRVAQERLRSSVDDLPGGHLLALANPRGLADQLLGYLAPARPPERARR